MPTESEKRERMTAAVAEALNYSSGCCFELDEDAAEDFMRQLVRRGFMVIPL